MSKFLIWSHEDEDACFCFFLRLDDEDGFCFLASDDDNVSGKKVRSAIKLN